MVLDAHGEIPVLLEFAKHAGLTIMAIGGGFILATAATWIHLLFHVRWHEDSPPFISKTFLLLWDDNYLSEKGVELRDRIPRLLLYAFRFGVYGFFLHIAIVLGLMVSGVGI